MGTGEVFVCFLCRPGNQEREKEKRHTLHSDSLHLFLIMLTASNMPLCVRVLLVSIWSPALWWIALERGSPMVVFKGLWFIAQLERLR